MSDVSKGDYDRPTPGATPHLYCSKCRARGGEGVWREDQCLDGVCPECGNDMLTRALLRVETQGPEEWELEDPEEWESSRRVFGDDEL